VPLDDDPSAAVLDDLRDGNEGHPRPPTEPSPGGSSHANLLATRISDPLPSRIGEDHGSTVWANPTLGPWEVVPLVGGVVAAGLRRPCLYGFLLMLLAGGSRCRRSRLPEVFAGREPIAAGGRR
jgi:hypothetical protein